MNMRPETKKKYLVCKDLIEKQGYSQKAAAIESGIHSNAYRQIAKRIKMEAKYAHIESLGLCQQK